MTQYAYPTQNRYSDPYQQRVTTPGSVYKQKYISRAYNNILKTIADNVVVCGLQVTPSYLGAVITIALTSGIVIHDSTLINLSTTNTITADVTLVSDSTAGSHLALFTDFLYEETPDLDAQTTLKLSMYHVDSVGVATPFYGAPTFSATRNKILVSAFDFTKSGANVVSCSEIPSALAGVEPPYLTISGTNYYLRGLTSSNINFLGIYNTYYSSFLAEFLFHDNNL